MQLKCVQKIEEIAGFGEWTKLMNISGHDRDSFLFLNLKILHSGIGNAKLQRKAIPAEYLRTKIPAQYASGVLNRANIEMQISR